MINNWTNYGDINPLDHNGIWIKQDYDTNYNVVKVTNLEESCSGEGFYIEDIYIDINDTWIDLEAVKACSGVSEDNNNMLAVAIADYYGGYNCGGSCYTLDTKDETLQFLNNYNISI